MPSLIDRSSGREYWRSLDELSNTSEFRSFVQTEFPHLAGLLEKSPTRRQFIKVMGASLGLAGLTGCRWPVEAIVPFAKQPTGRAPGIGVRYATTMELGGVGTGLLVTSYDGRPIKVEGNEKHPLSLGSSDALMQAAILDMYDPDRSVAPRARTGNESSQRTWAEFDAFAGPHFAQLRQSGGEGLFVLAEPSSSGTLAAVRARWAASFPKAQWLEYDALSRDNERTGLTRAFGKPYRPQYNLASADVLVSLESDFLLQHPAALRLTREFARRRSASDGTMNRLHMLESNLSLTGSNADYRYAVRSGDIAGHLGHLGRALLEKGLKLPAGAAALAGELQAISGAAPKFIASIADDVYAAAGKALILVGPRQPAEVHALAAVLNAALGSKAVAYIESGEPRPTHLEAIGTLAERLGAGAVKTLVILGVNPAYTAPAELAFADKLGRAAVSIHLGLYADETGQRCTWHVPAAHFLEAWGDSRAWDGTLSLVQPLIEPLYAGRTSAQLLANLLGEKASAYELTRAAFKAQGGGDFETAWRTALHDGVVAGSASALTTPALSESGLVGGAGVAKPATAPAGEFEVVFAQDNKVYDGRFANNGWLQELPDPLTKLTWDNAALISPVDARRLGLKRDSKVDITVGGRTLRIPVCVLPGHAPGSLTLPLGYGRAQGGVVASGSGFDAYALRASSGWHIAAATVKSAGGTYRLATTQDHHAMDTTVGNAEIERRVGELVREATLDEYKTDPKFAHKRVHELPLAQLFGEFKSEKHRWGMSIDLTKCTGCSACVVACQAENNIPVVGKEEVVLGREMQWMRIDRYFHGDPQNADALSIVHQPVNCMHCENAPCEQVCPVGATMHDDEGLNVMVYNRCIGTRYCSNNCPYKVRRYNWFYNYYGPKHPRSIAQGTVTPLSYQNPGLLARKRVTEIEMLGKNPDVTVRARGVMEKCTYCVQRIDAAKIRHRNESVTPGLGQARAPYHIPDGEVVPACAQACPAEAIVFGDLNDQSARVAKAQSDDRSYAMLGEFNFRPRTKYLAKLRNRAGGAGGHGHDEHAPTEKKPAAGHA